MAETEVRSPWIDRQDGELQVSQKSLAQLQEEWVQLLGLARPAEKKQVRIVK
jgi:hypothetical protein